MNINNVIDIEHQLGARIRFLRQNQKISIEELAFRSNINSNYLSDLERGHRNPTIKVLDKICHGLGVTLSDLLKGIAGDN